MADIPDNLVFGGIKNPVQGDTQFDNAQRGTEVPAVSGNRSDNLPTQFLGKPGKFAARQLS
jgi:hypothetical protein